MCLDPYSLIEHIKPETQNRYFNNEEHEATRYNASLTAYEKVPS